MGSKKNTSSWIQLGLFTAFLFLLVAIPYTLYQKSIPQKQIKIADLPPVTKATPLPLITPPPATTATTCISVPDNYEILESTPSAYFFQSRKKEICYPPQLPPFPFRWDTYTSYQYGYTIDTPANWTDNTITVRSTVLHVFSSSEGPQSNITPSISFAWYPGLDPYATDSSYIKNPIVKDGKTGIVYTKGRAYIAAVFPIDKGFLRLEASIIDSTFYAFQHMLDSLTF